MVAFLKRSGLGRLGREARTSSRVGPGIPQSISLGVILGHEGRSNGVAELSKSSRQGLAVTWFRPLALLAIASGLRGSSGPAAGPGDGTAPIPVRPASARSVPTAGGFGRLPLQFIPNRGQADRAVDYYVTARDMNIYFASGGLTFSLSGDRKDGVVRSAARRWTVKLDFIGASQGARPAVLERSGTRASSDSKGRPWDWKAAGLEACSKIIYRDLWPGIDLVYSGALDRIKYDLVVHPGADPSKIRLAYRGVAKIELQAGGLLVARTPVGGIEDLRRRSPTRRSTESGGPSRSLTVISRTRPSVLPWSLRPGPG